MLESTHHRTHDTYSPVGKRNLRMYWSGCQSTGAEMRKYLTAASVSRVVDSQAKQRSAGTQCATGLEGDSNQCTHDYLLAGERRHCRAGGFAVRPDLIEKSRVRQIVPEAAASGHGGRLDTCCAATRSSVECLGVGDVRRSKLCCGGNRAEQRRMRACQIGTTKSAAQSEKKPARYQIC
jgi:hypothetical protein